MIYLTGNIIVIIMLSDQESTVVGILPGHGHRRATMAQHGDLLKITLVFLVIFTTKIVLPIYSKIKMVN